MIFLEFLMIFTATAAVLMLCLIAYWAVFDFAKLLMMLDGFPTREDDC